MWVPDCLDVWCMGWQQFLSGTKMAAQLDSGMTSAVLKDSRSFRPFKSSEEYLYAMKEDLAEWLNTLYPELDISVDNFMEKLETGVAICKPAVFADCPTSHERSDNSGVVKCQ
uniref:(California timema) hypothetical protein n=1 Tax=Timema californicum TaxID=61474 RepID=A0A7R9JCP5_TIMCA|nr:unnamed protein product [Timema californicum]